MQQKTNFDDLTRRQFTEARRRLVASRNSWLVPSEKPRCRWSEIDWLVVQICVAFHALPPSDRALYGEQIAADFEAISERMVEALESGQLLPMSEILAFVAETVWSGLDWEEVDLT